MKTFFRLVVCVLLAAAVAPLYTTLAQSDNPNPPTQPVKLIFIHHSTGGNWLADPNGDQPYGGLGRALMQNNYFVSATNYGWGPNAIGDRTDIPNWPEWFTGPERDTIMRAVYNESGQNIGDFGAWPRLPQEPGGENTIIMFKSCFPNSDLDGEPDDPPLAAPNEEYTVANAKAVYNNILTYFAARQDKLFIIITAPPLQESDTTPQHAANARAFNYWLAHDWLADYPYANVAVFDYYNVLTGEHNHHRWNGSAIEHVQAANNNYAAYPSSDSHPSTAGHQKATREFVPLLNIFYHRWKQGAPAQPPPRPTATAAPPSPSPVPPAPATGDVDDFESQVERYTDGDKATITLALDNAGAHSGSTCLRVNYDIAPGGWGGWGRTFDSSQDWSSGSKLTLWARSEPADQTITLILFSGDPAAPTPFETHLETSADWEQFVFEWSSFTKPDWAGPEGLIELDPAHITGYGFSLGDADGKQNTGTLWVDDLRVISGKTQPPSQPIQPAPTTAPVQEQPTAAPPPTSAPAPRSGPCPAAMFVMTAALALGLHVNRRKS